MTAHLPFGRCVVCNRPANRMMAYEESIPLISVCSIECYEAFAIRTGLTSLSRKGLLIGKPSERTVQVTFTPEKLKRLKKVYKQARKEKRFAEAYKKSAKESFTFDGNEYMLEYAGYLIEYLEGKVG